MKSARIKERELIIELYYQKKKSTYEISDILGISQTKASFWVRRYRKTNNLENKPRSGRPSPLTNKSLEEIKLLLKTKLLSSKNKAGTSSKEVLQLIEQKTNKKYCLRHAERIMHKMGLSLITPRISHIKKDEKAQENFRQNFKKNFSRSIWAFQS